MHLGSCLCGQVTYRVDGDFGPGYFCHCQRCRKASGTLFAANARVAPEQFVLLTGADVLKGFFHAESGLTRKFCGDCGSPVVSERSNPPMRVVRLGTLDTPLATPPRAHIFAADRAHWDHFEDALPWFDGRPA